jgi:MscS family membrane protein
VRTFYNSLVTVPNATIVDGGIDNMGLRRWRRYSTTLGIAYHTHPDQVQAFVEGIRALIQANPVTRKDFYIVEFHGFGASSLDILVYTFFDCQTWNEELRARHVLNLDIMRLATDLDVEFAFPTQTLHVASTPEQAMAVPPLRARPELASIVNGYAPGGGRAQATDQPISAGFDA